MTSSLHVLISGGAGFIGTHLAAKLHAQGCRVRVLDCLSPQIHGHHAVEPAWLRGSGIDFQRGTVTSRDDWARALRDVDQVVHLAAETGTGQSMYEVARYNQVNSQGTALLLDVLGNDTRRSVRRVVLASSRAIYGEGAYVDPSDPRERVYPAARSAADLAAGQWEPRNPTTGQPLRAVPTRESDPARPASIYAATKYAQEDLVRIGCAALGVDHVIFRFQNVYGEGQSLQNPYTGILSIFSTRIRRGLPLPIFEDGLETRDFVHVDDVTEAVQRAVLAPAPVGRVFNVGSGVATTVGEIATRLAEAFGARPEVVVTGQYRVGDIRHNRADISALAEHLGFRPRIQLVEGLGRFARWVLTQPIPEDQLEKANRELRERRLMGGGA